MAIKQASEFSAVNKGAARYALLLECLSVNYPKPVSLAELARLAKLPKPSAFRLLKALQSVGFIAYDSQSEAYFLGARLMDIGVRSLSQNFARLAEPALLRLSETTDDTAFAVLAENDHMNCLRRITGSFPVRTLSLEEGDIWPLGIGAVGLALLAAHDDNYVDYYLKNYMPVLSRYSPIDESELRRRVVLTRETGIAVSQGDLLTGMSAIGVAIYYPDSKRPIGALSVAALSTRLDETRRNEIGQYLCSEARLITEALENSLKIAKVERAHED
ncbi:IclR family transcriptional regulator [Brucella gallinifaecis]|uniref:IclR family transcriptional regulator n=1 Tax=Brucella gallinifaecis TaxID=215590 RepID=A0A502BLT6_9HYPH|nr:IclR family transcriptional regulator [Brucella gallinifaecis]TPF74276.1 IclR family transcriptional regulator [Brucella gallinifaecis]